MYQQYRLLGIGERRQDGDEFFDKLTEGWYPVQDVGIGKQVQASDRPYRRPLFVVPMLDPLHVRRLQKIVSGATPLDRSKGCPCASKTCEHASN